MSYIDKNLLTNEQIVFRTKKHTIIFLIPLIWAIATLFCLLNSNPYLVRLAIIPGALALITGANKWLQYLTSEYVITNQRIMMREGFFFRRTKDMLLKTISNITVNQSLLAQLLNYGTLVINPFGGNDDVFSEIAYPFLFQKEVQERMVQQDRIR